MSRRHWFSAGSIYYCILAVFLYLPIVLLLLFSFNDSESLRFPLQGFTLRWYREMLSAGDLLDAVWNSVVVGLLSSLVATILGAMAAVAIMRYQFPGRGLFLAAAGLPLVIPSVVIGVALLILYRQLFDVELSLWTVGLGHAVVNIPVVMLIVARGWRAFRPTWKRRRWTWGQAIGGRSCA